MKTLLAFALMLSAVPLVALDKASEELDIREAVYRYQFQDGYYRQHAKVFCLDIVLKGKSSNPDDAFMQRFFGDLPVVKKASGCYRESMGVKDKATLIPAVIFRTEAIKWISDSDVEVEGGDFAAGNAGSGNTYYLRQADGKWTVQKSVRHWVS